MSNPKRQLAPNELRLELTPKEGEEVSVEAFLKVTKAALSILQEIETSMTGEPAKIKWLISDLSMEEDNDEECD